MKLRKSAGFREYGVSGVGRSGQPSPSPALDQPLLLGREFRRGSLAGHRSAFSSGCLDAISHSAPRRERRGTGHRPTFWSPSSRWQPASSSAHHTSRSPSRPQRPPRGIREARIGAGRETRAEWRVQSLRWLDRDWSRPSFSVSVCPVSTDAMSSVSYGPTRRHALPCAVGSAGLKSPTVRFV